MKAHVVIIEDEKNIREFIAEILELEGATCAIAPDGESGIRLTREFLPDLIICDIMMPKMDGYDVLLELRKDPLTANIPFIFLTALADRPSLRHGMELGADDYLTKPFRSEELLAAVTARLQKKATLADEYAQQVSELHRSLLHTLPHELRAPLTNIIGNSELLLSDSRLENQDDIVSKVRSILESGKRLQRQIENHLYYAQLEILGSDQARLNELRNQQTDCPQTIIRDIANARAVVYQRSDDLNINSLESVIQISRDDFGKIVGELLDNAFKFSKPGSPITVSAKIEDHYYTLNISDNGRGMSVDQIKNVSAFVQFGHETSDQDGTGLGLAIVRRLVDLYGGDMLIQSEPDHGTRVRVKLLRTEEK